MLYRDRKPIDFEAKTAKYRSLKINDNPRFLAKIAKLKARKDAWWAVLKAVNRYENFKDSEDNTPSLVEKQFQHVVCKHHTLTTVRDEAAEESKGENKENEGENKDKMGAARD
jgi:hypothetical protein